MLQAYRLSTLSDDLYVSVDMKIQFPIEKQPLLTYEDESAESQGRFSKHPHGWSRQIQMLHEVGEIISAETLQVDPLYFEIGSGHGDFIERKAKEDPNGYYIGVENVPYFALSGAKKLQKAGLTNALMLNQNANDLLDQVFPDESLDKIYILYPDPWPKNRHEKRRLIREATYQRYHQVLKPGGEIEIWTDSEKWVTLSLPFLKQLSGSIEQEEVADDTRDLRTLFERKAKSKGHPIFHILYKK